MKPTGSVLGYDSAPPISAPLRFFLSAPLFGIVAGVLLVFAPSLLESRWTPGALSITHLLTVGFMLMVMVGALFQVLPVVCGAAIPAVRLTATVVHVLIVGGALALAGGLLLMKPAVLMTAATLLGTGFAAFLFAAMIALLHAPAARGSQRDLRLALIGLGVAVMLGLALSLTLAKGLALPLLTMLELHVGWALLGGTGILLAATSWIVVPMFQITPPYPATLTRYWASLCILALTIWSVATVFDWSAAKTALSWSLVGFAAIFLIATLTLMRQTRRNVPDASFRSFRLGIWSLLGGLACLLATGFSDHPSLPVLTGVLVMYGGFVSIIQGMLYKIVPFLAWLNLTQSGIKAPNVKQLQPEAEARRQLMVHGLALAVLIVAVALGNLGMVRIAGLLVMLEFAWLASNMLGVIRAYRRARTGTTTTLGPGQTA